jgi:hypothetical protein
MARAQRWYWQRASVVLRWELFPCLLIKCRRLRGACRSTRRRGFLQYRWQRRMLNLRWTNGIAFVLLACGLLLTFPPIGDLF